MFVGSINADVRALLAELSHRWKGCPVYVGCSGNLTVERILHANGVAEIHGNDVSLYSCVVGSHLAGESVPVTVKRDEFAWLTPYLSPGIPTIATLLLCTEYFNYIDRSEPFHVRMARAHEKNWPDLHARSCSRVAKALEGVKLASFTRGDVVDYLRAMPDDAVVVSFPPTYRGGYERLYKKIDEVFSWDAPTYQQFDDERFAELTRLITSKAEWVTLRDADVEDLRPYCVGRVQTGARMKPVYVYAGSGRTRITGVRQKTEVVPWPRLAGEIQGPLSLVRLTSGQLNTLRSEYLAPGIIPSGAQIQLGLVSGGKLLGAMAFVAPDRVLSFSDSYMLSDFAIRPSIYPRLSKLVLVATLSTEVKAVLEQSINRRVQTIGTTAFTKKPVSQKYRGIYTLYSRKESALNYVADAGRWTLAEGLEWWKTHHGQTKEAAPCLAH